MVCLIYEKHILIKKSDGNYLEKTSQAKCTLWIYRITNVKIST